MIVRCFIFSSRCFHPRRSTSIPSNFLVLSYRDIIVPFRNEKAIAGVEKKNSIRFRWKENDATFKNALERLTAKMRRNELMTLHKMASERVFLLELKAKYAGLHAITLTKKIIYGGQGGCLENYIIVDLT